MMNAKEKPKKLIITKQRNSRHPSQKAIKKKKKANSEGCDLISRATVSIDTEKFFQKERKAKKKIIK